MVDYSDRLKSAMEAENVSTQMLADHLKVSYQAVKKVLDGKSKAFSAPNHEDACELLKVSGKWLAKGEGPRRAPAAEGNAAVTSDLAEDEWMAEGRRILSALGPEDRRAAVLQLRVFVAQLHTPRDGQDIPVAA